MPRSAKCRRVCQMPAHCRFAPEQPAHGEAVELTVEEYEAVRLMDYLGLNQEEASAQMGVARTTVQRIYAQESCRGFSRPCGRCASQDGKEASS